MKIPVFLFGCFLAMSLPSSVRSDEPGVWGNWTKCSKKCGGGLQSRDKFCPYKCGTVEVSCHIMDCADPYQRQPWSDCTATCDGGTRRRESATAGMEPQVINCSTHSCIPMKGDCIADVVFVMDSSGSIGSFNWFISLQFVIDVMQGLKITKPGTRVGVVIYSNEVELSFGLTKYYSVSDIKPIVFDLEYMAGVTNTADGIKVMREVFNAEGRGPNKATPIGIVITDGESNIDKPRTLTEAQLAKDANILMFSVAIGSGINEDEINGIATHPDYVFKAATYGDVQRLSNEIAEKICTVANTGDCGHCGDYNACSESCGRDGIKYGTKECWLVSGLSGKEIPNSRTSENCNDTCHIHCPIDKCDDCGNFGSCSESCGKDGRKDGNKECWQIDGETRVEIAGKRHKESCTDTCHNRCTCEDSCADFGPCSESCGADGTKEGTKDCWAIDEVTDNEITGSRHKETCTETCFNDCPTTTTTPWRVDCSRCDFTKGQIWLANPFNCHLYYICEPLGNGDYRVHSGTCGELFWNQAYHTCVPVMPADANCEVGPVSPYSQPSTTRVSCPYEPYPGEPSKFWVSGDPLTISNCLQGMEFVNMGDICDCLPAGPLVPKCEDDLLLHFPYEDHFNDVTCHHAIATQYGDGVSLQYDAQRQGNVACFTGGTHFEVAFLRTWFANNKVDKFSVSVWFKRQGEQMSPQGIVNNGDCIDTAGFLVGHTQDSVVANITTEVDHGQTPLQSVTSGEWHQAVWVYDGTQLKLYIDKILTLPTIPITGYLTNNDVPMYIASCCGEHFFVGCLDELRVYERVLM